MTTTAPGHAHAHADLLALPAAFGPALDLTADEQWARRARRLTESASRAAEILPEVQSPRIRISGPADAPELDLECVTAEGNDPAAVEDSLRWTVVRTLEELLGREFARRQLAVRLAAPLPA